MIIGIDASRANELRKTGTEWYAYYLIQEFKKIADPNDQFILYSKEPLRGELAELPANFISKVLNWPPKFLWTQLRLSWEMFYRKPDVLFVPAHTIPFLHPKNTVTTLHDVGFERFHRLYSKNSIGYKTSFSKWVINILVRTFTLGRYGSNEYDYHRFSARFALKHAKTILTVSNFTKSEILELFGRKYSDKIAVTLLAYDNSRLQTEFSSQEIDQILKKYHIQKSFILYIGRLEEKKNISGLIEAFNILKKKYNYEGQLVLIGKPGYRFESAQEKITEYGLENYVIQPGWITEEERIILLKSAEVFVFPSFYEGFGIPPLEAMSVGTPVVASNSASIPEVVGDAALLVDPNSPAAIAKSVSSVINNEDYIRDNLIKNGYIRVKQFSWGKTASETLSNIKTSVHS
ncbi:MAG: glycosyltransferase family 1 protein [Patescibacteria group bacterium]|jgi:glycosyltransferase involved in cell wall biosynthesis